MNKNIIITILGIAAIIIAVSSSRKAESPTNTINETDRIVYPGEPQPQNPPSTQTKTISGVILEKDDGCFADGICKINVDGTWVITNQGWYQGPLGTVADGLAVGVRVEAYGKVIEEGITMLGNDSYYVKIK